MEEWGLKVFVIIEAALIKQDRNNILTGLLAAAVIFIVLCLPVSAAHAAYNPKYASVVIDADTGAILSQRYGNKVLHPASLTKMMTLLLLFEAIDSGKVGIRTRIPISSKAASQVPSKIGLPAGSSIRVKDAILALVTKSANDVAVAVAEKIGGTERRFAWVMNQKALRIGMTKTVFRNASGLHHKGQVSTATDMARLARYIIKKHPRYYRYFSTRFFSYRGKTYENHNRLMKTYKGMDGMKTGYIRASGFNLVASAVKDNRRIIGVVFGGKSAKTRNRHMEALLNTGFGKIRTVLMAKHKPAPRPIRKPMHQLLLASLEPQAGTKAKTLYSLLGEGDIDPGLHKKFETGVLAISAHTGNKAYLNHIKMPQDMARNWAIQIGAYSSRVASDKAIRDAQLALSHHYPSTQGRIVPGRSSQGILFRARLLGLNEGEAHTACSLLDDCLVVAP